MAYEETIEKLFALQDELQEAIDEHPSDVVRTPLQNIRGDLSHLADAIKTVQSWERV